MKLPAVYELLCCVKWAFSRHLALGLQGPRLKCIFLEVYRMSSSPWGGYSESTVFLIKKIYIYTYMCIYIYLTVPGLGCGMWVPSSLIRNWTQAPCTGSVESWPLNHQQSLVNQLFKETHPKKKIKIIIKKPIQVIVQSEKVWDDLFPEVQTIFFFTKALNSSVR